MAYSSSRYICVNGKKFYAGTTCGDGSVSSSDRALAYQVGNATYYVPLSPGQASGLNVNIGGNIYHACNAQPLLYVHAQSKTLCPFSAANLCTCVRVDMETRIAFSGGYKTQVLSGVSSLLWSYTYSCCHNGSATLQLSGAARTCRIQCNRAWTIWQYCGCGYINRLYICGPSGTILCTVDVPYSTDCGGICSWEHSFALSYW